MQFKPSKEVQRSEPNDSLWYLLGLRSSLSFRLVLLSIFPCALSPIFIDRANYGGSNLLWLSLILVAHTGFSICILIAGKLIHRSGDGQSHPVGTLLAFLFAQGIRGSILGFSTVFLGFSDDPKLAFRILSGGVFISTVLSVIAISIAIYDQHSNLVIDLEEKSSDLFELQASLDSRLKAAGANLREFARQVVSPRVDQIDQLLTSLKAGGNKNDAIKEMQNYVDNELRPLSHQIAHDNSLSELNLVASKARKRFKLPSDVNLSTSMRPYVTTMLFFITYAAAAQRTMTFVEALPFNFISTVLLIIYFTFFKWIFRNSEIALIVGLPIGLAVFAIVGPLVLYIESFINIQRPEYIGTATIFVGTIYGMSNLGYTILTSQRTQMVSDLTQVNENLETTISLLRQKEWIARRQVGYVMHGSLQSSLNAAVLQLGSSADPSAELIESVRSDISKALARVSSDSEHSHSFEQAKDEITKIWAGAIQINWMVDPKALAQIQRNPETSECLAEVVREAVSNAAKHGLATQIEIVVKIEDSLIFIEVEDNGKSSNTGKTQGLGCELFDDLCSQWELVRTDHGGMKLSANLVLQHFGL